METKIKGLSALNVKAIEEVLAPEIAAGTIATSGRTATFQTYAETAARLVRDRISALPGRGHPRASLHAVARRLDRAAVEQDQPIDEREDDMTTTERTALKKEIDARVRDRQPAEDEIEQVINRTEDEMSDNTTPAETKKLPARDEAPDAKALVKTLVASAKAAGMKRVNPKSEGSNYFRLQRDGKTVAYVNLGKRGVVVEIPKVSKTKVTTEAEASAAIEAIQS